MPTPRLRLVDLRSALAGPFTLDLARGECLAITGLSGAGKSLFLRMVADLDPSQGDVFLDGTERHTMPATTWRRRVVYSAAEPGWWHENVADHFRGDALRFARDLAPELGLAPGLLNAPIVRLSTGERQRIALIRTLSLAPPALLLDEPTGALDQESTERVEELLRGRLAAGVTIAMVTHSAAQAERLGSRHMRMEQRHLVSA